MATRAEGDRSEAGDSFSWAAGLSALLFWMIAVFALAFLAPKLQAYWANFGILPPLYGRVLIAMARYLPGATFVGLILVGLAFRPRR